MSSVESGQSSSTLRSERIAQGREFNAILQANGFPHAGSFPLYLRDECQPSVRAAALLTLLEPSGAKQGLRGSFQQHPEAGSGDTKPLQTKAATWPSQVGLSLQKSVSPSLPSLGSCMLVWTSTSVPDVANRAHSLCTRAHYLGLTCGSGLALNAQKGCMTGWCSDHTHRDHQGRLFRPRGQDAWQSQCLGQALLHTAQSTLVWKALEHLSLVNHWFL